ncbi:MAG: hypothetical protein GX573_14775 [Chloroflexi bacterium]|nr:hypothetical protein [Chloroflexota bacterium]
MCQNPTDGPPTTREQIFRFLVAYKREHDGNSPTTREIAEACCLGVSTVNYHLTRLEIDHRIRVLNQRPRAYEIVGGAWDWSGGQHRAPRHSNDPENHAGR